MCVNIDHATSNYRINRLPCVFKGPELSYCFPCFSLFECELMFHGLEATLTQLQATHTSLVNTFLMKWRTPLCCGIQRTVHSINLHFRHRFTSNFTTTPERERAIQSRQILSHWKAVLRVQSGLSGQKAMIRLKPKHAMGEKGVGHTGLIREGGEPV